MLQLSKWSPGMTEYARAFPHTHTHIHTHTHTHSKNTVLYNFWFSTWCWQKWTQKSKQFSCSSIDSVCLSPGVNHRFLRFSRCFVFVCFLCCLCRIRRLLDKCAAHKKKKQAQTLNESNFISPTTTLIVCEVSKMFPKTHTWQLRPCSRRRRRRSLRLDDCVYRRN